MIEGLGYDDVLLVPTYGILEHRKDADLTSALTRNHFIRIPIISAPMPAVTGGAMAKAMCNLGAQAVIHRQQDVNARFDQYHLTDEPYVAIGVDEGWSDFQFLYNMGVTNFCLDVAHGHHHKVGKLIYLLKDYPINLIAGNVATVEGAKWLEASGADAIKVGIGPGAACRTREVTGFGVPQLTAIMDIAEAVSVPIIADGGIKNSGDIVKALAAGASTVMLGRLLAGADEAPKPGEYYGNASARVNNHRAPEGVEGLVELSGPVEDTIKELCWGLRSGISYAGATNIKELQQNAEWIKVSHGVTLESQVRV